MNNQAIISGTITSIDFSHEILGEKFYIMNVSVIRLSNATDIIPVMVSDRIATITNDNIGNMVKVFGHFRSYNKHDEDKIRLMLFVFAEEIVFDENIEPLNEILLYGFVCKKPTYRETPFGRQISDVHLAVNRLYGKSDYIPCVVWGRNARFASTLPVGDYVKIFGRIQSREYVKDEKTHVAYEVSVQSIEER